MKMSYDRFVPFLWPTLSSDDKFGIAASCLCSFSHLKLSERGFSCHISVQFTSNIGLFGTDALQKIYF